MSIATFVLQIPAIGASNFVQDWIQTDSSLKRNITVTLKEICEMCRITIVIVSNTEKIEYLRNSIFGKDGELTKKFWLAVELKEKENIEDLFSIE